MSNEKKVAAGRLGGLALKEKYGREVFVAMGRAGGRPRALTLDEILKQSQPLGATGISENGGMDTPRVQTNSLRELKRLWRNRRQSDCQ
jgi:hypothetical protein